MDYSSRCSPVSVILVTAGSRGQRVLFRYPYQSNSDEGERESSKSHYALPHSNEGCSARFSDSTLANILTPKPMLCGQRFELKIDNMLFVGHPMLLNESNRGDGRKEEVMMKLFNIVFILKAEADPTLISSYHDLSKRLAIALKHEERRCRYLTKERETMLAVHDEVCSMPEVDCAESPFLHMLPKSKLAVDLKDSFESLCTTGVVQIRINGWVNVSFCLPQKVHNLHQGMLTITPKAIETSLASMRPYHTLLFLVDEVSLLGLLPGDCSPAVTRLIRMATPLKSFTALSQDTDIPLSQVFAIAAHLVHWGKASIIYPLCESNLYVVAQSLNMNTLSPLAEGYAASFPGKSLHATLADFSLPSPLAEHYNPLASPQQQAEQVQMVVWMLQHRLLIQLHTYIFLVPSAQLEQQSDTQGRMRDRRRIRWIFGGSFTDELPVYQDEEPLGGPGTSSSPEFGVLNSVPSLTYSEMRSIHRVPAAKNEEDLKLFARLAPYFRGRHHLEEIMYYENLRRSQLLTLMDKFRDVLYLCQHEDPSTACFHNR
ncbi:predicted protein [Nematostella vectensis]|uniref:GATOR complex protein NPRL3 n=1 Tax=Nematostella vectensis TaxID=45351 RepID=A7RUK4_NEMVE|nr:predicted protein [Nematostella vectensis]|eukprot:XP_001636981.1 predicted protein [Nematostella vectensis]